MKTDEKVIMWNIKKNRKRSRKILSGILLKAGYSSGAYILLNVFLTWAKAIPAIKQIWFLYFYCICRFAWSEFTILEMQDFAVENTPSVPSCVCFINISLVFQWMPAGRMERWKRNLIVWKPVCILKYNLLHWGRKPFVGGKPVSGRVRCLISLPWKTLRENIYNLLGSFHAKISVLNWTPSSCN